MMTSNPVAQRIYSAPVRTLAIVFDLLAHPISGSDVFRHWLSPDMVTRLRAIILKHPRPGRWVAKSCDSIDLQMSISVGKSRLQSYMLAPCERARI
jgi:hypothetical protein